MRNLEALKYVAGSIVVYYVMAACSGPSSTAIGGDPSANGGGPGGSSSGNATSNGSGGSGGTSSGGSSSGNGTASSGGSSGSSGSPVPDANADEPQSGSRLKATYYVGADGSKQFAYFTDSGRNNEQCAFITAADGSTRCLPSGAYLIASEFADSSCTVVVGETSTCASPAYVIQSVTSSSGCRYEQHVYASGGAVSMLYAKSGTDCVSIGAPSAGLTYVTVGAEIAASSFEMATLQSQ